LLAAGEGPRVLLVSLKAGGTGLNLSAASRVHMLEPYFNPAVEDQVGWAGWLWGPEGRRCDRRGAGVLLALHVCG
jgi:hypothetical protein